MSAINWEAFFILLTIFLISRELICWYWKQNEQVKLLKKINDHLETLIKITPQKQSAKTTTQNKILHKEQLSPIRKKTAQKKIKTKDQEECGLCKTVVLKNELIQHLAIKVCKKCHGVKYPGASIK